MKREVVYRRKLSGEEALKRYILVLNESLKLFPKPCMPFKISIGEDNIDVAIKLSETWNKGARKPTTEYHIDLSKHVALFRPHYGQMVALKQVGKNQFALE